MDNLIGDDVERWPELVAEPGAHLHLYGKGEARPGRKMGHVTRVDTLAEAGFQAVKEVRMGHGPALPALHSRARAIALPAQVRYSTPPPPARLAEPRLQLFAGFIEVEKLLDPSRPRLPDEPNEAMPSIRAISGGFQCRAAGISSRPRR